MQCALKWSFFDWLTCAGDHALRAIFFLLRPAGCRLVVVAGNEGGVPAGDVVSHGSLARNNVHAVEQGAHAQLEGVVGGRQGAQRPSTAGQDAGG